MQRSQHQRMAAAAALLADNIKIDLTRPERPDWDRFGLSEGHGSIFHYALDHFVGYAEPLTDQLAK